ncbi:CheR family methyltransferase [Thalassococcus sp. BH17M4-6]|uniref:CheR family methyltransferase n=1 Tax=Thalassococcus sp. BH17M4-6 TaxID=3413148 RepID=UPI003BED2108
MAKTEEGDNLFPVVGVGASAGGLEALREMFGGHKGPTDMAFVVVQHLDPTHESLMAELIDRYTAMTVRQAEGNERLKPNHVYVIPPGFGLALQGGILNLTEFKDPRGMRRPIDDFFESLAHDQKNLAACVILSGTGADGSRGLRAIKENGGLCVVERPESAAYDGMPSSAINTGLVDIISEPRDILGYVRSFFQHGSLTGDKAEENGNVADSVDELCDVLRQAIGHDFSQYKRSTLNRRIARRMQVLGIEDSAKYLERLRSGPEECDALFRDLLINVTRFFRDPKHFDALNRLVIDPLVANCRDGEELRIWVPGCSSGEEAYSIAMLFAAAARTHGKRPYVQIFATDIDDKMLELARNATYPLSSLGDIPKEYQDDFVDVGHERFAIAPRITDMVRFSVHNLVRDPPYSKIDLISCRNLLIYFEDSLQKLVVPLFHFALRNDGLLFLGSSEAIGRHDDLFEVVDQSVRVFRRKNVKSNYTLKLTSENRTTQARRLSESRSSEPQRADSLEVSAMQIVAQKYAPVSFLLDREGLLLDRWGKTGRYLDFPERLERTVHVPTLAKPGLREKIGPLIRQVAETGRRAGIKSVDVRTDFGTLGVKVVCEPVQDYGFLFIIEETRPLQAAEFDDDDDFDEFESDDNQVRFLEDELRTTRYRLRSTVEELETTNEELKSSNEEMMSMNEELQSTNEELTTVNDELKSKVDQLTVANSDLRNFFDSTQLAVLVVDAGLNLRSFTDAALEIFPIDKSYIGRPLDEVPGRIDGRSYVDTARRAAGEGEQSETNLHSSELGAEYILRSIPYRLMDGEIDGATLVFTDVTEALSLQRDLREERERLRLALEVAKIGIWEYEPATDRTFLDATERELLNIADYDSADTMEPILASLPADDRDRINRALRMAIEGDREFNETFRIPLPDGGVRWLHGLGKQISVYGTRKFIGVTFDISHERALLDQRELMIREMNHRVKNLFSVVSAMVSIAGQEAEDIEELVRTLRNRILSLGKSHALTLGPQQDVERQVNLEELIDTVVAPNQSSQTIEKTGEDLTVNSAQITSLALVLHEWATNSSKYGALSVPDGRIEVTWTSTDTGVELVWTETGGADTAEGTGAAGFGTRLVTAAARQLGGEATGEDTPDGYRRTLSFEASSKTD